MAELLHRRVLSFEYQNYKMGLTPGFPLSRNRARHFGSHSLNKFTIFLVENRGKCHSARCAPGTHRVELMENQVQTR